MLPLRQKSEFGTLKEVVLGRTDHAAFPPKSKANANFTDHIADLGPAFYDKFEEGQQIPIADVKPELVEAYATLHDDLTKAYESEGVKVQRIITPTNEILNYFGFAPATGPSRLPTSSRSSAMWSSRPASATTSWSAPSPLSRAVTC